jgi:ADP-heptose:LPS heptosyltransferase
VSRKRGPRVLVLRALGLGDLLTAVPALRALRSGFSGYRLDLALPAGLHGLAMACGVADRVIDVQGLEPLPHTVNGPEVAVNLHGRGPQSHQMLAGTGPRSLLAFRNQQAGYLQGPVWLAEEHERVRWCRLVEAFGISADPHDVYIEPPVNEQWQAFFGATLIHPGAASPARRWPVERFAAVAQDELRAGRQVVVTGTSGERHLALCLTELAGLPVQACLAGQTTVLELAALVAVAGRVLSGDTGIAHLAAALRTPSVTLFGPTSPERWGPPSGPHIPLWRGREGDPHAGEIDPGLLEIEVGCVIDALRTSGSLLESTQLPGGRTSQGDLAPET